MTRCRNPSKHARKTPETSRHFHSPQASSLGKPPWYLVAMMLFWSCVDFTSDRLLLNVLWTDWVCLGPGSNRSILCPTLGTSTKNVAGVFRCSFPGITQLGCSSFLKPTAVPSKPVLDATGFRPRSSPNRLLVHPRRGRRIRRSRNDGLVSWPPSCLETLT